MTKAQKAGTQFEQSDLTLSTSPRVVSSGKSLCNILILHEKLPHAGRSGADARLMQVLQELRNQGHRVTYVARNGADLQECAPPLEQFGIRVWAQDAERMRSFGCFELPRWKLEQIFEKDRIDLAILFLWFWTPISIAEHYLDHVRKLSPATRIVVMTDDQHGLREMQLANLTGFLSDYERASDYARRELEVYRRADAVVAISEEDRKGLLQLAPEIEIGLLPMVAELFPEGPSFAARSDVVFLGDFDNLANRDSARWMLEEIWPLVRKSLPNTELALVGNNLPTELSSGHEGVVPIGHVDDLTPVFSRYRVFVSPIRVGTGIKTKNLAALERGLPLVTTSIGAKGMGLTDGANALIADTPEAFADAVIRVYTENALWQRLSQQGRRHIASEFSHRRLTEGVCRLVESGKKAHPKPFDPLHTWSCRLTEERFPQLLEPRPSVNLTLFRVTCFGRLAEELLQQGKPEAAIGQLRHAFSYVRGESSLDPRLVRIYQCMERCYRALGDVERADRCRREAQKCPVTIRSLAILSAKMIRWLLDFHPQGRLHGKCLAWMTVGQIVELYHRVLAVMAQGGAGLVRVDPLRKQDE